MKFNYSIAPKRSKMKWSTFCEHDPVKVCIAVTLLMSVCDASITLSYQQSSGNSVESGNNNATLSFFFTGDPQFGWGTYYSGNEERALRTMIDLGRLTQLCSDCPQVVPIAGDLTMNGENRHIYRLGYQAAQSFGVKILDGLGNHDTHPFGDDEVSFDSMDQLRQGQSLSSKGWMLVDAWTTVMSPDNECGHYCRQADGHYYTIAVTNRKENPHRIMAYIVQLHNAIYSATAVQYLRRISRIIDRNKPVILVAHQFAGDSIANFNATLRQFKVALIINGHYHCDQQYDLDHCDFRDNEPGLLIDRFGSDFVNSFGAVIPRVTSNAAFHNIFWSVTLDEARGVIYLKRYNNHFVARTTQVGPDGVTSLRSFRFSLAEFQSPNFRPFFGRHQIYLRQLDMWPATFSNLINGQFNLYGFNLPYQDARALMCTYNLEDNKCVDNYRVRYL